ncbi:MAG: chemotaxis protein CheR, partial [bacterium]
MGECDELFATLDRKSKLYQRKEDYHGAQRAALSRFLPPVTAVDAALPRTTAKTAFPAKVLRELTEQMLLRQVAPAGALVNGQGDILYLHGRTGMYLEPTPGEAGISNILKMAREGLRHELTAALHKAARTKETVRHPGLRVKTNGDFTTINLSVCPVAAGSAATFEAPLYLVTLEELPPFNPEQTPPAAAVPAAAVPAAVEAAGSETADAGARIAALQHELRTKEEYLQAANEELETSNEELKSSNEEMQSVNEELQSTNEELETSKEELQSVNE